MISRFSILKTPSMITYATVFTTLFLASLLMGCNNNTVSNTLSSLPSPSALIYRMDIKQGNALTEEMVAKLKKGMSREQVRDILGTPVINHSLHANRWDYYYSFKPGRGKEPTEEKHITVYFKNNSVHHFEQS